jgi:ParB family chromosome partitioning protein
MESFEKNQKISQIRVDDILVGDRIREAIAEIEELKVSLARYGLLQPIIIDKSFNLIAGFRRVLAAKELNWEYINALVINTESERERVELEMEENLRRQDFTPEEIEKGRLRIKELSRNSIWAKIRKLWFSFFYWLKDKIFGFFYRND